MLKLDKKIEIKKEERVQLQMNDEAGRRLVLSARLCSKDAGFKVSFSVSNCLINGTDQNLLFFYEPPG